jgi:hypothetical protein
LVQPKKLHRYSLYNAFVAAESFPNRIPTRRYTDFDLPRQHSAAAERRMSEVCAMQASKWDFDNTTDDDAGNGPSPRSEEALTDRFGIRAALPEQLFNTSTIIRRS